MGGLPAGRQGFVILNIRTRNDYLSSGKIEGDFVTGGHRERCRVQHASRGVPAQAAELERYSYFPGHHQQGLSDDAHRPALGRGARELGADKDRRGTFETHSRGCLTPQEVRDVRQGSGRQV